jgi:dTDP-glucose 4,6-dehydratase
LAEWLLTILLRGQSGRAYNVGSEEAVSILEVANIVADLAAEVIPDVHRPDILITVTGTKVDPAARYIPKCARAHEELRLRQSLSIQSAIVQTLQHKVL